jgi:hypothetical protein
MNQNNLVLENTSLFLDLDQAILQLADVISHYNRNELLMVVLCEDAMPLANVISRRLGLDLTFSTVDLNRKTGDSVVKAIPVDFDYGMIKGSGRDIPQDFIVHQEQNLRSNLIASYKATYESITKTSPDKLIILLDRLTNIDAAFYPCLTQNYTSQSGGDTFSNSAMRQFVFMHARMEVSGEVTTHGVDMIIGSGAVELEDH